jgi:transcriptional regulator with XRE-family HTH domain
MVAIELGKRVQEERLKLKASYEDIEFFSGIASAEIALIEQGKFKEVSAFQIEKLAFALGSSYKYLVFGRS